LRGDGIDAASFASADVTQAEYEQYLGAMPHLRYAKLRYWIRKLQFLVHFGHYEECPEIVAAIEQEFGPPPVLGRSPVFEIVEYCFFSGLARAATLDCTGATTGSPEFAALMRSHDQLMAWAEGCPDNFLDRATLLAAEIARLEGRDLDAQRHYDEAVRLARNFGAVQNESLANERAGQFYAQRDFGVIAEAYLRNAQSCYLSWGADGKARQLERLHPCLGTRLSRQSANSAMTDTPIQHLDLAAVVEMYQAFSREIMLDQLIERLMITVVEHAGAVRGLLLLPRGDAMRVVAEAAIDHKSVTVDLGPPVRATRDLPQSIVNYVIHTHEVVIVDDALAANPYSSDDYLVRACPRSVLCVPLLKQQRLVGVLYLENNLASHIFTPDRLSILQLLASQAAISIENAELFRHVQETQDQARRVGEELRRSFDMIPALAWRASPDGLLEFANKQWRDFTGVSIDEARGQSWIRSFHPDDAEKVANKWRHLLEFRTSGEFQARMRRVDGEVRRFLVRATPMQDSHGNIVNWHGTHTDIENLKRAEQAQEALARVSRITAMGELTVSIAHEVSQPLMAIVTNAATCLRWLADDQLNVEEARVAAERIIRHGHRAGDVIASIRGLARKAAPEAAELDLREVILEVLLLTRNKLDCNAITVETDLAADTGTVLGDRVQMQQVILNLIINGIEAIGASYNQPRLLRIRTARADAGGVQITVSDTGIGLPKADDDQIFDAFFTTKEDGIGIGLSICRSIVEAHRGRLWASRNQPHGTAFHFTVPAYRAEDAR
jgi:PAS domain S-box-containing protein